MHTTRRLFCSGAGAAAALLYARPAAAVAPSDKLTVACIGVGSQGLRVAIDLLRLSEVQIVAVCDVNRGSSDYLDWGKDELRGKVRTLLGDPNWGVNFAGPTAGLEPAQAIVNAYYAKQAGRATGRGCTAYTDFRELLAREKDLDAVVIGTPDHWHAVIAIAAMRAGKHVYSQKPMAHTAAEARQMAEVAGQTKRATQVSVFNSQTPESLRVIKLLGDGTIGPVTRVDLWTTRASSFWRQGLATPQAPDPVPASLNWDMWQGPAPARAYSRQYLPFVWRAWFDYGCGAIGDMGEYGFDTIFRALHLGAAESVEATSSELFPDCYPVASTLAYRFAARGSMPPVELHWYDGGIRPERPHELALGERMGVGGEGVMYTGAKGRLIAGFMSQAPRLLHPDGAFDPAMPTLTPPNAPFDPARPELGMSATASSAAHYREWIGACHGGPPASGNFQFQAPIVEALMLGNIAIRTQEALEWDIEAFRLKRGTAAAAALLTPRYRAPWESA